MKPAIPVLLMILLFGITSAQTLPSLPGNQIKNMANILNDKDDLRGVYNPFNSLREEVQVPINETDSIYNSATSSWEYEMDAVHQYFTGSCKDSLITYSVDGAYTNRDFLKWDSTLVYQTYKLNQAWNGTEWVIDYEYQTPVQYGCYIDWQIYRDWNGSSWDTTLGIKEDLIFDLYGRIEERHYYRYVDHEWVTYRRVFPHYGVNDTLIGIDDFRYSTTTGELTSGRRDTNYVWLGFYSFCFNTQLESISQVYDIDQHTWNNSSKRQYTGHELSGTDTFFYYLISAWNGNSYDSSSRWYNKHDYIGNLIDYYEEYYDSTSQSWINSYSFQYNYTYGLNNEITRIEYLDFNCDPYYYSTLVPCYIHRYSNFTSCDVATNTAQLDSGINHVTLFPNPAQNVVTIQSTDDFDDAIIVVYDIWGRKLEVDTSLESNTFQLNISLLSSGIYVVEMFSKKTGNKERSSFVKAD